MTSRAAERALECVGTPWHAGGRIPGVGLDCVGLVLYAHEQDDAGRYARESIRPTLDGAIELQRFGFERTTSPQDGDICIMAWRGRFLHLGVSVGDSVVHCVRQVRRDRIVGRFARVESWWTRCR